VGFGESIRYCFAHFATFSGRASRSEFWWFFLFSWLVLAVAYLPLRVLDGVQAVIVHSAGESSGVVFAISLMFWALVAFVGVVLAIPTLAVGSRRLHDRGQSGWLQLLMLIPCGVAALVFFWVQPGTTTDNIYGPSAS
jgi:uncharacterized membrane protein YhaH (DUF805 family)